MSFLEICGFNRARQRDKIARLLDNFVSLQDEVRSHLHNCKIFLNKFVCFFQAERVDTFLHKQLNGDTSAGTCRTSFGTWILYHCLRAMSLFLLSGLELELYSVHEYLYVFWWVDHSITFGKATYNSVFSGTCMNFSLVGLFLPSQELTRFCSNKNASASNIRIFHEVKRRQN